MSDRAPPPGMPGSQVPLALVDAAVPGFDTFVTGDNRALVDTLRGPLGATPVYLWGAAGTGKSHLLGATAALWQQAGARVAAFGMGDAPPWDVAPETRLLLLDDVGRYDAAQQHAAFTCFVEAATHGTALIAAGRLPPVDLPVREDLRTRLGWGLVFQVHTPTEEQVRAVLRREADRRGILLDDRVMHYLLTHLSRDLGHLMGLLGRLDEYSLEFKRRITVELVKDMLHTEAKAA